MPCGRSDRQALGSGSGAWATLDGEGPATGRHSTVHPDGAAGPATLPLQLAQVHVELEQGI